MTFFTVPECLKTCRLVDGFVFYLVNLVRDLSRMVRMGLRSLLDPLKPDFLILFLNTSVVVLLIKLPIVLPIGLLSTGSSIGSQ